MAHLCVNTVFSCNTINIAQTTASLAERSRNTINAGVSNHVEGEDNIINGGTANHVEGSGNIILPNEVGFNNAADNCHVEGLTSKVAGFQNHVEGCDHHVLGGFEGHVIGCGNTVVNNRDGQNISGFGGYFTNNRNADANSDIYNYSNQLAGGLGTPEDVNFGSKYNGEGISVIDKTLLNGIYPIGQHQSYLNTSDGLSYSVMLKGKPGLNTGIFVTFGPLTNEERLIIPAHNGDDIVGVITTTSGFIANAGQFPASTRIEYDEFHQPIEFENKNLEGKFMFPGHQTILKQHIDRSKLFIPFTDRPDHYQVTLSGLVVVRAKNACKITDKCDVKCGKAVKGNRFWVINIIDRDHIMILLK